MGYVLSLRAESEEQCPFWFTKSDGELLSAYLLLLAGMAEETDEVEWEMVQLQRHFDIDLTPLKKIGGEEMSIGDFRYLHEYREKSDEEIQTIIDKWKDIFAAAWQPPEEIEHCLTIFISILDQNPEIYQTHGIKAGYFLKGFFRQDLEDLRKMVRWAIDKKIRRVRIDIIN